jgi:hypothetical protein
VFDRRRTGGDTVVMIEIGGRRRTQPAPPAVIFEALTQPDRDPARPWLLLLDDEQPPLVLEAVRPSLVLWSSLWTKRPDAFLRFDIAAAGAGSALSWTLSVTEPAPDDALAGHLCRRVNELVNASLRYSFGQ